MRTSLKQNLLEKWFAKCCFDVLIEAQLRVELVTAATT